MSTSFTKEAIERMAKRVNERLKNIELRPAYRYGYTAIDVFDKKTGHMKETLISGLTKREAFEILFIIEYVLRQEQG
jgi:hypothetical protein